MLFHYPLTSARYKIEKCSSNWTDGDDERMKLNERGSLTTRHRNWLFFFLGLCTKIIRRFSSPFLKIPFLAFCASKNRHFSGSIFGRSGRTGSGRVAGWPKCGKIVVRFELKLLIKPSICQLFKLPRNLSKCTFQSDWNVWNMAILIGMRQIGRL